MIKLENITKVYEIGGTQYKALKGLSFTINKGELFAIVGQSGSGKTSTMNIIGLLDKPTTGKYYLDEIDTSQFNGDKLADLRNERLGFIFQLYCLLPKLSALENVMLPLTYRRKEHIGMHDMKERGMAWLEKVGMAKFATHRPNQLSGGQQQRIAIARAMIGRPSIIMADEPTGALDSATGQQIMDLLVQEVKETGTTVVIVTHSMDIAKQCQRMIRISDGLVQPE